ncbi:MAG: pyruvate kinase [Candidatus Magasanikbacteria bacterium]|nr:pyruvate kinase [Candidatus Magasanikbacteria bacterium]
MKSLKRTKIVCTIGPASASPEVIEKFVKAGMDAARVNFSHGTHESNSALIKTVRRVAEKLEAPVAIIADLQGPRVRIGEMPTKGAILKKGEKVILSAALEKYQNKKIPVTYKGLTNDLKSGQRILLDDGKIELLVRKISGRTIEAEVRVGGILTSHKGINLPDSTVSVSALTEKDKDDLKFILKMDVDFIALSFVKEAKDILDLRRLIKELSSGKKVGDEEDDKIRIIAKVEKYGAIKNIDEIIDAVDGVMVARGDLGLEMPEEDVPLYQKKIIGKCLTAAKPVIVATQMLESMTHNPRPTRAEVSDVANAVIDHTDAVMLSGETATGEYPVEAVETMSRVLVKTEASVFDDLIEHDFPPVDLKTDVVISGLSRLLAEQVKAKAILGASLSGETGRQISRFRPELPIFIATSAPRVQRQLNLSWGVRAFRLLPCKTVEELVSRSLVYLRKKKLLKSADKIIIVAGEPVGHAGNVNLVEVKEMT